MTVQLHTFVISAPDGQKLASGPSHFTPWGRTLIPILQSWAVSRAPVRCRKRTTHARNKTLGCPVYHPVIKLTELFHAVLSLTVHLLVALHLIFKKLCCWPWHHINQASKQPPTVLSFKNICIIYWCLHAGCSENFPDFFYTDSPNKFLTIRENFTHSAVLTNIMTYKTPPIFTSSWSQKCGLPFL